MQAPKAKPRFLPTLTEVVKPVALPQEEAAVLSSESTLQNPMDEGKLVAAVMERLMPALELQIQDALRQSMQIQLERLLPAVMADLEGAVRSAIRTASEKLRDADRS